MVVLEEDIVGGEIRVDDPLAVDIGHRQGDVIGGSQDLAEVQGPLLVRLAEETVQVIACKRALTEQTASRTAFRSTVNGSAAEEVKPGDNGNNGSPRRRSRGRNKRMPGLEG